MVSSSIATARQRSSCASRAPMRRRRPDDRQDEVSAAANLLRKRHEIVQRPCALQPRNPVDFLARAVRQILRVNADGRFVLLVRQGQRQPATHAGIRHRCDGVQGPHVRAGRAGIEMIHHAGAARADHFDDPQLGADVDRLVGIFAPAGADVLPPDFERQAGPAAFQKVGRRVGMRVDQPRHHDARRRLDAFGEVAVRPRPGPGLREAAIADHHVTWLPDIHAIVCGHHHARRNLDRHNSPPRALSASVPLDLRPGKSRLRPNRPALAGRPSIWCATHISA